MKTMMDLPDDLYSKAQASADREGIDLGKFFTEGVALRIATSNIIKPKRVDFPIIRSANKEPLDIPADAAFQADLEDDLARYEASLRQ